MTVSEFKRINDFFKPLSGIGSNNLTDDIANIPPFVVSTDSIAKGVHFIGNEKPDELAIKLLALNLSDLASSGAVPFAYTLNLATPQNTPNEWFANFANGLSQMQQKYNISLLGGDSISINSDFVLSATVFGKENKNTTYRANGKIGDFVCLTGKIGGAGYGLKVAKGELNNQQLLKYYTTPIPHTQQAQVLNSYINACIDVSDGLVADLNHICEASNIGMDIKIDDIPVVDEIIQYKHNDNFYQNVLTSGDDYVLACTISSENIEKAKTAMGKINRQLYIIGKTIADKAKLNIFDKNNQLVKFLRAGYEHK